MRAKSAIYTPKRDEEHLRHFYMGVPKVSAYNNSPKRNFLKLYKAFKMNRGKYLPVFELWFSL